MLRRRLVSAFIGALLGAVVELVPVVVEAQQPLRVDSEQDVVEVSRQVVGTESLPAPPVQEGGGILWVAACASGLGIFGGWLLWGRRQDYEDEAVLEVLNSSSVLGLGCEQFDPTPQNLMGLSRMGRPQVARDKQAVVEWGDYPTPVEHVHPAPLPVVFEDPEPRYHAHPVRWYEDPEPADHCFPQVFKPVVHPESEVEDSDVQRFNDWGFPRQNVGGVELVDLDTSEIPWVFDEPVPVRTRHRREPAMVNR